MKYYAESKDIIKYWEEIDFKPDLNATLFCIAHNEQMTLTEKLSAYEDVAANAGDKSALLSTYVEAARLTLERFKKDELSENVVYCCDEIYGADHSIHQLPRKHYNTLCELLFHVRKRCNLVHLEKASIYVTKVYPKENCLEIEVSYTFEHADFVPYSIHWEGCPNIYNFYDCEKVDFPLPFKPGDVLYYEPLSTIEVFGGDESSYYLARNGVLHKGFIGRPIHLERLTDEEVDNLSDKFAPLIEIANYLKQGTPIPEEILGEIVDITDSSRYEQEVF